MARIGALHDRILAGDSRARDEICALLMDEIRRTARRTGQLVDKHVFEDAIEDAVLKYLRDPRRYQPLKGTLFAWLTKVTINNVLDSQRSMRRRLSHEVAVGDAQRLPEAVAWPDQDGELERVRTAADAALRRRVLEVARNTSELALLEATLSGASTETRAAVLGVKNLPARLQRREVNRAWNRIHKRLVRLRNRLTGR